MKSTLFPVCALILLTGCQAAPVTPIAPPAAPRPVSEWPAPSGVRTPEVVKTYMIGAYVDPDDPTLRHEAHMVHRIEAVARWDLRPMAEISPARIGRPTKTEAAPTLNEQTKIITPAVVPVAPPPVELSVDPEPAVMPNSEGFIDLVSAEAPTAGEINPFEVRSHPVQPPREIVLQVTGILAGARPCAVINGGLVEPGGTIEGFTLRRIEPGAIILTLGRHRLRVPLSPNPVRIRLTP